MDTKSKKSTTVGISCRDWCTRWLSRRTIRPASTATTPAVPPCPPGSISVLWPVNTSSAVCSSSGSSSGSLTLAYWRASFGCWPCRPFSSLPTPCSSPSARTRSDNATDFLPTLCRALFFYSCVLHANASERDTTFFLVLSKHAGIFLDAAQTPQASSFVMMLGDFCYVFFFLLDQMHSRKKNNSKKFIPTTFVPFCQRCVPEMEKCR